MSVITFKGGKPIPQKPRKKKNLFARIFWPIFIVVLVLPIVSAGVLVALIYDDTHVKTNCRDNYPNEEVFSDVITHSLDYTEEQHQMRLRLTEDVLNQLFHNVMYKDGDKSEILNNFYVKITNHEYIFGIEFDLYGWYQTRLLLSTKLKVTEEDIIFKVTDIQLGRISGLDEIAKFIISHVEMPDINKVFEENGFNMTLDLSKLTLTYPKESLYEDLIEVLGDSDNVYVSLITDILFNDNYLTILPNCEKAVEFNVDLENMRPTSETYNIEGYEMPEGYLDELLPNSMTMVKGYLDHGTIDENHAEAIANYYVRGYDYLEDSHKNIVDSYLSSHTISEATDTYEYVIDNDENLMNIATSQLIHYGVGANYYEVSYTTDQIDRAISQAQAIGTVILFKAKDADNNYTVNYVAIDRVSTVIDYTTDSLFIVFSLSFNGYDVAITMKSVADSNHNVFGQLKFDVDNLYLGNDPLSETTKELFMSVFTSTIEEGAFSSAMSIHFEGENVYILIDLSSILTATGISPSNGYSADFSFEEQTATEPGVLKFIATK